MENKFRYGKRPAGEDVYRYLVAIFLIVGIITAALNVTFGGFAPIYWFLLALTALFLVICHEVYRVATILEKLENKK